MLSLPIPEYESRGQNKHCDLSSEECEPDAHGRHLSVDAFTKTEKWPAPQYEHAMDPELSLYLPATQPLQTPFAPDQPGLQEQYVILAL